MNTGGKIVLMFLIIFAVAMLVSSIGFKKYVWFISLGYGFSVMAIGITLFIALWSKINSRHGNRSVASYIIRSTSRRLPADKRAEK